MIVKNKNLKIAGVLVIGSLLCTAGGIAAYTSDADEGAETAVNYATYLKAGGAAVRLKDVNAESIHNGIRFISLIDAEKYAELEALETNDTDTVKVDYGMTIVPYDYVAEYGELNKENLFGENAKYYIDGITEKEEGKTMLGGCIYETLPAAKNPVDKAINLSIVNLPEKQLVREFIGVAFIRITTNDAAEYYVGGYTQEETRSMAYVTQAALNDTNSTLTEDQKSFLQTNYLDNVNVKDKEYTYSTEHIFVNLSGKETLQETVAGEKTKIGATVTATPNSYEWYEYDEDSSVNTGIVYANNRTVLKLYYKEKLSSLSLGEGVVTADGKAEYAKDSVVTLKHTGTVPQGTVFDGFKVDGERIAGETFTINKTSHVIEAVYATAETMTWFDGTKGKTPAEWGIPQGEIDSHKSNGQTMYVLGASNNWAIRETVYGGYNANANGTRYYYAVMSSSCGLFEFQVKSDGSVTAGTAGSGAWNTYLNGKLTDKEIYSTIINATQENPVTFTSIRSGNDFYMYANDELLIKAAPKFNYSNPFGYGSRAVGEIVFPTTVNREYITGTAKVDALVSLRFSKWTWFDGTDGKTPTEWGIPEGEVNSHKSNGQTMYVLGASNNWAIRETVYGGYDESKSGARYYFGFMISSCSLLEFQVLSNGNVTIGTSGSGSGWANYLTEKVTDRSIYSTIINATQENPVTFTVIRREKDVYFYANDELLVKVTPTFSYSNPFGYGSRAVGENIFPTTAKREYITDTVKIDALLS